MRVLLGTVAALALSAAAAFAGEEVMTSRFGNTTITSDASGASTKIYYEADHSFTGPRTMSATAGPAARSRCSWSRGINRRA
jgi:hypothetical protein